MLPSGDGIEVVGGHQNFWLHSKADDGQDVWDLTHPLTPTSPHVHPRMALTTTTGQVIIDPAKTALVVIDLQNYFLSSALGRPADAPGHVVIDKLLKLAIVACRKADIPVLWLNWGLTDEDIESMPPAILKGFTASVDWTGKQWVRGLGSDIGEIKLDDGTKIQAGRVLVRGEWNTESYGPLKEVQRENDIFVDKNRLSGFWGGTGIEDVLHSRGIRTLLFAGVNLDKCVAGSLQDAFAKGWDCLMLSDACATTTPEFARQCVEFNVARGWGFLLSCEDLLKGAQNLEGDSETRPPDQISQ